VREVTPMPRRDVSDEHEKTVPMAEPLTAAMRGFGLSIVVLISSLSMSLCDIKEED
jgi:hypothetical protein